MKNKTLKNIFEFLKKTEDKTIPFIWKFYTKQPLTEDDLYIDGDLELGGPIESLPKGLEVYGDLCIADTRLEEYTDEQLRKIILPGFIKGKIIR